jgi:hypothetical protein
VVDASCGDGHRMALLHAYLCARRSKRVLYWNSSAYNDNKTVISQCNQNKPSFF